MSHLIHLIAAARPNFMKVAPLYHALAATDWADPRIVHTGQHYDPNMSDAFFSDLRMPKPHHHLGVGSGSHAEQTAGVMLAYEKVALEYRPAWIVVVGDVNSTLACSLVGAKLRIPVAHLEAGLRSRDRDMPEEINRVATDAVSDLLWTPSPDGDENLRNEGVPAERIERVGNIMIDSFELMRENIAAASTRQNLDLQAQGYGVVTLHRPSNVDRPEVLTVIVEQLLAASEKLPLVFPVHPRTRKQLQAMGLWQRLEATPRIRVTDPFGYVEFMNLVTQSALVITDSGGVQEETTYLSIPCMTLRNNTERPVTVTEGSNRLIKPADILPSVDAVLAGDWPKGRRPELWDGHAADRVVASLARRILARTAQA